MNDVDSLKGIHGTKTMQHQKKRSIPKVQSSPYLDIYMMQKEKERILKELKRLEMRHEQIRQRLTDIETMTATVMRENFVPPEIDMTDIPLQKETTLPKEWNKISFKY